MYQLNTRSRISIALLLCLALIEIGAHLLDSTTDGPIIPDPVLNHIWRPNSSFTVAAFVERGIPSYTRKVNSLGWTGEEIFNDPKSHSRRIVFLGDSFTEGTAPIESSMPTLVATNLGRRLSEKFEAVNTGTQSYSPTLMYLTTKFKVLKLNPEIAVISVDMTDPFDDYLYSRCAKYDHAGDLIACPAGEPFANEHRRTAQGVRRRTNVELYLDNLTQYSAAIRFLTLVFEAVLDRSPSLHHGYPKLFGWCINPEDDEVKKIVQYSMVRLEKLIAMLNSKGIKVYVTAVPHRQQFSGEWSLSPFTHVREAAKNASAEYIDSFGGIRTLLQGGSADQLYISGDMHFNPKGYQLWSEVLANQIIAAP